jgi:endonuclease/exonuclease/phosphatase family metal-dependent hydrolase
MKLIQLNVWMGRLSGQLLRFIESERPDILTTQEIFAVDGPVLFPEGMFNSFELIKTAGQFEYTFFSPTWSMQAAHQTANFGNAIFSKYPIVRQESFFTHGSYNPDLTPDTLINNTRNAQLIQLDITGKQLCLANHHAHWEPTPEGSSVSAERMQQISSKLAEQTGPVIFAGDLNVNPGTPTMQVLPEQLKDLTAVYKVPSTLSVLGKVHNVACDHILVNDAIKVRDFHVSDELVSDHKALVLEFDI